MYCSSGSVKKDGVNHGVARVLRCPAGPRHAGSPARSWRTLARWHSSEERNALGRRTRAIRCTALPTRDSNSWRSYALRPSCCATERQVQQQHDMHEMHIDVRLFLPQQRTHSHTSAYNTRIYRSYLSAHCTGRWSGAGAAPSHDTHDSTIKLYRSSRPANQLGTRHTQYSGR